MLIYKTAPVSLGQEEGAEARLPEGYFAYYLAASEGGARQRRLAGLLLLAALMREAGHAPGEITVGQYGKPDFVEGGLFFSISHAGTQVAVALSDTPCGIDIEPCDRPLPAVRIARLGAVLTPREKEALFSLPEGERPRAFLERWVKKEAYTKRTGRGLADLCRADTEEEPPRLFTRLVLEGEEYLLAIY